MKKKQKRKGYTKDFKAARVDDTHTQSVSPDLAKETPTRRDFFQYIDEVIDAQREDFRQEITRKQDLVAAIRDSERLDDCTKQLLLDVQRRVSLDGEGELRNLIKILTYMPDKTPNQRVRKSKVVAKIFFQAVEHVPDMKKQMGSKTFADGVVYAKAAKWVVDHTPGFQMIVESVRKP